MKKEPIFEEEKKDPWIIVGAIGFAVATLLAIKLLSGCSHFPTMKIPESIAQASPEELAADNTLVETKDMPASTSCMSQSERDGFRDLRKTVELLRLADKDKTSKLDLCNANLIVYQSNLSSCLSSKSDLEKKHRFDWATDLIGELGAWWKGVFVGFLSAIVLLAAIKAGIVFGKLSGKI